MAKNANFNELIEKKGYFYNFYKIDSSKPELSLGESYPNNIKIVFYKYLIIKKLNNII